MPDKATLLMREFVTHDVQHLLLSRPDGLHWQPGQGIELAIDQDEWRQQRRPFTPTCLLEDRVLEFTIKRYPEQDGVTDALHALEPGAQLLLGDPFGTIAYQGPGTFIAAGTGVTPFLAILRRLAKDDALAGHRLLLTNKRERDVICAQELAYYLGDDLVLAFTREHAQHRGGRMDSAFLEAHIRNRDGHFYVCGPDAFVEAMKAALLTLGVRPDRLVYER
ncbi:MAG: flavodoxin reductase [Thiohalocapsa sp.]|jgi:cytochrome-b5 reductase|uniref:flavodoxin reductase n=1 Tax=Thiohalocapsa sp. TaxID=2497641 RepID=UPI0025FCBE69|nr:flavodoxin reductase [Thiohalocapsa sp.]MCG6943512.1 flavodoxin reductase [Thiohalocapsa sp.]